MKMKTPRMITKGDTYTHTTHIHNTHVHTRVLPHQGVSTRPIQAEPTSPDELGHGGLSHYFSADPCSPHLSNHILGVLHNRVVDR